MKNKVTKEQVEFWLGSDFKMPEILETLRDLANGDYKQDLLKKDIINTCLSCGFIDNRFTKGIEMILNSKFNLHGFKNYDVMPYCSNELSRCGWTGNLWRHGHTAHVAHVDNDGTMNGTVFSWNDDNLADEDFKKFCASLPPYTNRERIEHYGGVPTDDDERADYSLIHSFKGCHTEYKFTLEIVVDILATEEDKKQKEII